MRLSNLEIVGLKVETLSGHVLGTISRFDIEVKSHTIVCYHVGVSNVIKKFLRVGESLLIAPDQVVSIDIEKMIVVDNSVSEDKIFDQTQLIETSGNLSDGGAVVSSKLICP